MQLQSKDTWDKLESDMVELREGFWEGSSGRAFLFESARAVLESDPDAQAAFGADVGAFLEDLQVALAEAPRELSPARQFVEQARRRFSANPALREKYESLGSYVSGLVARRNGLSELAPGPASASSSSWESVEEGVVRSPSVTRSVLSDDILRKAIALLLIRSDADAAEQFGDNLAAAEAYVLDLAKRHEATAGTRAPTLEQLATDRFRACPRLREEFESPELYSAYLSSCRESPSAEVSGWH